MLLDLHIHTTRYSTGCSVLDPRRLVGRLLELGIDGGVITEHNYLWSQSEIDALKDRSGKKELFLACGKEVESDMGHLLVFGYAGQLQRMSTMKHIVRTVHEGGGAVIWAHPLRYGRFDDKSDEWIAETASVCDGIEALTPSHSQPENERALALAKSFGLTATGGSDAHTVGALGRCLTRFNRPLSSMSDLVQALREGACSPVNGSYTGA